MYIYISLSVSLSILSKISSLLVLYSIMAPHKVPIIIGVGEAKNPSRRTEDAIEPLHLMLQAIREAVSDACNSSSPAIISSIDSVKVVASSTWPYKDLPGLVCEGLGIKPSHTAYSELAGSASVQLIDDTARMIANEQIQVGVVVGGEAMASCLFTRSSKREWHLRENVALIAVFS